MQVECIKSPPFNHYGNVRIFRIGLHGLYRQNVIHSLGFLYFHIRTSVVHIGDCGGEDKEELLVFAHRQGMRCGSLPVYTHIAFFRVRIVTYGIRVELRIGGHHREVRFTRKVLLRSLQAYNLRTVRHFLTDNVISTDAVVFHFGRKYQVQRLFIADFQRYGGEFFYFLGFP